MQPYFRNLQTSFVIYAKRVQIHQGWMSEAGKI